MMLLFWPVKVLLRIPLQYALLWLYSPIAVIFFRTRKDRHNFLGEVSPSASSPRQKANRTWRTLERNVAHMRVRLQLFIRYVWDPPLLTTIYLVGLTRLGGDRFLFPFCTLLDERIGALMVACVCLPLLSNQNEVVGGLVAYLIDRTTAQPWARCRCPGTSTRW
jgi:hypothetical protein